MADPGTDPRPAVDALSTRVLDPLRDLLATPRLTIVPHDGLSLDADLVTLSACETALSRISRGDDVVGFTRGLLYAGAGSVLSTLWKVDDAATSRLVQDFYRSLAERPKDGALRQAQLETRKTHPHPFYWAAFVLAGNV
jgi:CHAT domain-containing protein